MKKTQSSNWTNTLGTPIGICVIASNTFDNNKARIIGLDLVDQNGLPTSNSNNCVATQGISTGCTYSEFQALASSETSGLQNTEALISAYDNNLKHLYISGAIGAFKYQDGYTNNKWYLPADEEALALARIWSNFQVVYTLLTSNDVPFTSTITSTVPEMSGLVNEVSFSSNSEFIRRIPMGGTSVIYAQI